MSDIFFTEASEAPVPPAEVRVRTLDARARPDGVRVDVHLELTPFQQRPNIEVVIKNAAGSQVAALSVIEAIDPKMDFTMHIRQPEPGSSYTLAVQVFYSDVEANAPSNGGQKSASEILQKSKQIVDQRELHFETPSSPK
jgi:hypothetical protein